MSEPDFNTMLRAAVRAKLAGSGFTDGPGELRRLTPAEMFGYAPPPPPHVPGDVDFGGGVRGTSPAAQPEHSMNDVFRSASAIAQGRKRGPWGF